MLKDALDAFVNRDPAKAQAIIPRDKEVRTCLTSNCIGNFPAYMVERPSTITRCLNLMVISKSLERVADHATNVAEEVCVSLRSARTSGIPARPWSRPLPAPELRDRI